MLWGHGVRVVVRCTAGLGLAAVLAACGGGQQVQKFAPHRIISFGDESSVIIDSGDHNGSKYTVNALNTTTGALDCKTNLIWNQYLAAAYALVFPQCNPDALTTTSQIRATVGATVADVRTQIDQFLAQPDSFSGTDLVTVMAGANDVLAQYALVKAGTIDEAAAAATLEAAGASLADDVNRIAQAGGKVLITTIPDMGTTPFALTENLAVAGHAALLTRLSARFNAKLRVGLINDGHMIGLILANETFSSIVKNLGGFVDVTEPVCTVALPGCRTDTLVTLNSSGFAGSGDTWLWADPTHLSAGGQRTLGAIALTRATGNPF